MCQKRTSATIICWSGATIKKINKKKETPKKSVIAFIQEINSKF
jgi:hypothetical protein